MNKLLLIVCIPIFVSCNVSAENKDFFNHNFAYFATGGIKIIVENRIATIFKYYPKEKENYWEEFTEADIKYGDDGFSHIKLFGEDAIVILGGNHIMLEFPNDPAYSMYIKNQKMVPGVSGVTTFNFRVDRILASSMLSEEIDNETIEYSTENLINKFMTDSMGILNLWNNSSLTWVEGEEGPGIGVTLDIAFTEDVNHMLVLNGFVDPGRKHLYKMNSRPKLVKIESLDESNPFSFEYEFEDKVKFSYLSFPKAVNEVRMTILEVYPGSKWQDTSISGILANHTWDLYDEGKKAQWKSNVKPFSERYEE